MWNTCWSVTTMMKRTRPIVTFYVRCFSCFFPGTAVGLKPVSSLDETETLPVHSGQQSIAVFPKLIPYLSTVDNSLLQCFPNWYLTCPRWTTVYCSVSQTDTLPVHCGQQSIAGFPKLIFYLSTVDNSLLQCFPN